jgi:trk system potassium uptake protein TrkH
MRLKVFISRFGTLLKLLAVLMLIPGIVAAVYGEPRGVIAFALTSILTLAAGIAVGRVGSEEPMGYKEAFALVAFGWLGAAFFGALPYFFMGTSLVDGLFESMSGFTTTGSSILTESNAQGYWIINATMADQSIAHALERGLGGLTGSTAITQPTPSKEQTYMGLLFWRSFSQWLGGMGIILLFIAVLPKLGVAGRQLYKAEVPGPEKDALTPRIRQTAKLLWWVYLVFTAAEVLLLVLAGTPLYDSLCNTFASMATGGFSPKALSIAAYNSALVDAIITAFMFLAGANFALHYRMLYLDRKSLVRDSEFKFYTLIVVVATAVIILWGGIEGDLFYNLNSLAWGIASIQASPQYL